MARVEAMASPGRRRSSNSQLLHELEALSQSLYKSQEQQPTRRGGSLSSTIPSVRQHAGSRFTDDYLAEKEIPLPGIVHARQAAAFMSPRNVRHSITNPHVSEDVSSTAGLKHRFSISAESTLSGFNNVSENVDIRGRRKRNSLSPFRWRKHEENHKDHERHLWGDHASGKEVDFNRSHEESAEKSKFWTWKPLRALSHIGLHRHNCVFSVYVNAIERLSASMNGLRLAVYLRKKETKEGAVQTMPSRVFEGTAEFDETLHIRCHVYGGRHGSQGSKFQSRPFTLSVVAVDAEELDMGKHELDLSMLLQDTEQIQAAGEECNGWNATFDLWGKARGAKLAVGLGYEIIDKDGHGNNVTSTMSARYKDSGASRDRKILKSLPDSARGTPKTVPAGLNSPYETTKFSPLMVMDHLKLDEEEEDVVPSEMIHSSLPRDLEKRARQSFTTHGIHHGLVFAPQQNGISEEFGSDFGTIKEEENQEEEADFEVVEIQEPVKEEDEAPATAMDSVKSDNKKEEEEGGEIVKEVVQEKQKMKKLSELDAIVERINNLESVILEKSSNESLPVEQLDLSNEADEDVKVKRDLDDGAVKRDENINALLDDEAELVEGEFLHMLEEEDEEEEEERVPEIPKAKEGVNSNEEYIDDDMELASILEAAENELQKATQSLDCKRRAALLEDEEAEALMQEWGLDEEMFQNSPPKFDHSGLSGRQVRLPDLGEGLGSLVHTRDGGMLVSMNPGLFRSSERLVMHLSKPVVVSAEMGDNAVEVFQRMAGMGTVCMAEQALACMPLDDITGKTMEQIAFEGMASAITKHGHSHTEQKGTGSRKPKLSALQSLENMNEEYVSLECIAPLAIRRIEAMALEGLKIQTEMAEEEPPYSLPPVPLPKNANLAQLRAGETDDAASSNSLMSMVISLDEWTKLDAGILQDEEETKGRKTKAILASHRAILHNEKKRENGIMGNSLRIALLVQLRDPLRNNEAVGFPMIAFVQAWRVNVPSCSMISRTVYVNPQSDDDKEEEDSTRFKIKGVHLAGLKLLVDEKKKSVWGTEKQHITGSRWLLANGMAKNPKHSSLKSKLNEQQTQPQTRAKHGESIWSISAPNLDTTSQQAKHPVRNPDVVFPKRTITWRG